MPRKVEDIVRDLIAVGGETRNLDYKGPTPFGPGRPEKAELIRDIMCLSNTQNGGHLLIGVAETVTGYDPVGLNSADRATYDQTAIADAARLYCSVVPDFVVRKAEFDGRTFVLIEVSEFDTSPIVCTRDQHTSDGRTLVLRAGTVYARTTGASCEPIQTAEDMNGLIELATTKSATKWMGQFRDLLQGAGVAALPPGGQPSPPHPPGIDQAEAFFEEQQLAPPFWQVAMWPIEGGPNLSRRQITNALAGASVLIRGWDMPHFDTAGQASFEDGIQSATHWRVHHEAFRAQRDGLFVWRDRMWEDLEGYEGKVDFISVIWSFTEFLLFASQYASRALEGQTVVLEVVAAGLHGRELVSTRPGPILSQQYTSELAEFRDLRKLSAIELVTDHLSIARDMAREFFELFNWLESAGAIEHWQTRFLNREW